MDFLSSPELASQATALGQVLMIDLVLAGDNAVAVGLAAAALAPELRRKAILIGLIAAVILRIGFALVTVQLLAIVGLLFLQRRRDAGQARPRTRSASSPGCSRSRRASAGSADTRPSCRRCSDHTSGAAARGTGGALRPIQSGKVNQYGALLFAAAAIGALILVIINT